MTVRATYQVPNYAHERVLCGINTFRNKTYPDGFKMQMINANSLEQLKEKIPLFDISFEHYGASRPLKLSDCSVKFLE